MSNLLTKGKIMIRIMSTRVIRFYNPNQKLVSDQQTADGMVVQEIAIPAAATIGNPRLRRAHQKAASPMKPASTGRLPL